MEYFVAFFMSMSLLFTSTYIDAINTFNETDFSDTEAVIEYHSKMYNERMVIEEITNWEEINESGEYRLIVNGKDISSKGYVYVGKVYSEPGKIEGEYALIPFTTVIEQLGGVVSWNDEITATIEFNGNSYDLDTKENTLSGNGFSFWFGPNFGYLPINYFQLIDGIYITSNQIISSFLKENGYYISFDVDKKTVEIDNTGIYNLKLFQKLSGI